MQVIPYSENVRAITPKNNNDNQNNKNDEKENKVEKKARKILCIIIIILLLLLLLIILFLLFIFYKRKKKAGEQCEIGDGEKCKTCDNNNKKNCLTCNYGYYLPLTEEKQKCISCKALGYCLNCNSNNNSVICSQCENGYMLNENKCEKEEIIEDCTIGENEKCKTCNSDPNLKNECLECNEGYYLPSDGNKKTCQSCATIQNCIECSGTKDSIQCLKCEERYSLIDNKCINNYCNIGNEEKCASCKTEIGKTKECATCNEGYFIPDDTNPYICTQCSTLNCKTCSGPLNQEKCYECKEGFNPIKVSYNDVISVRSCECPSDLRLFNGKCVEYENGVEIIHYAYYTTFPLLILNDNHLNLKENQLEVYINDSIIEVQKNSQQFAYQYPEIGIHKINIILKKKLTSLEFVFCNGGGYFKSFKILPNFDSSQVTNMNYFLDNTAFTYCDLKYLNTSKVYSFKYFLYHSTELTSLDLSNFDTSKATNMASMFEDVYKMQLLDLSSFDTSNVKDCKTMFAYFSKNCTIKISNKFTKCREQIRYDNTIINIDELSCNNFDNCKSCIGSHETLECNECILGYELKNGQCIQPKCNLGENEKCLKCQTISGKENECLECNEGYYIPINSLDKKKCVKCNIDGCKTCDSDSGACSECKTFYEPIMNSGSIIQCQLTCDIGDENKCLTCKTEEGEKNKCGSCNYGYKLVKNGTCQKIENSFTAIFKLTSKYRGINIINREENEIQLSDIEMYVNGTKVTPFYRTERFWRSQIDYDYISYNFKNIGIYEVKIIFKKTLIDMQWLFYTINYMTNIKFSETFDTSHVLNMKYLFSDNEHLQDIDVSSFNTSIVGYLTSGFHDIKELTSLDISNFNNTNIRPDKYIWNCIKLKYIDISSFDLSGYTDIKSVIYNISAGATIVINKKYSSINSQAGYNFVYKE